MAHSNAVLVETIAEQLALELQAYQLLLDDLRAGGWSIEASVALSAAVDRVQRGAENIPGLKMRLAEFLITRTELSRRVVGVARGRSEELARLHAEHLQATNTLRLAALHQLAAARRGGKR